MPLRSLANPRTRWRRSGRGSNAAVARPRDREFLAVTPRNDTSARLLTLNIRGSNDYGPVRSNATDQSHVALQLL